MRKQEWESCLRGAPAQDQRAKVEELIGRLTSNREVPKIFVGRKEDLKKAGPHRQNPAPGAAPMTNRPTRF